MVTFWWKRIFQFTFVTISFNFFVRYIFVSILFGTFNPFCETGNLKNRERKENYAKFTYSEKATKFCEISTVNLTIQIHIEDFRILENIITYVERSNLRWRFRKILWPSQNIWTLPCPTIFWGHFGPSYSRLQNST